MAIFREVETTVYCDVCGEYVIGWHSKGQGVSRAWAAYHARQKGCTTGKKDCMQKVQNRAEKAALQFDKAIRAAAARAKRRLSGIFWRI